jgi:release factor glutamine methyltransferase
VGSSGITILLSIKQALQNSSLELQSHSETPRLDAQLLISFCTEISREKMLAYPEHLLSPPQEKRLHLLLARRMKGEPLAYILGTKEFWSMELKVSSDTLIPRPETECVVEWILQHFKNEEKLRVADLGTGSGAIAIALASEKPLWEIHATDLNEKALKIAKINADQFAPGRISFFHGSWCFALPQKNYDLIVSNPPYIAEGDPHLKSLGFEPKLALVSGKDGLDAIRKIAGEAKNYLQKGGYLVLEHGFDQSEAVCQILQNFSYNCIEAYRDLGGSPRFVAATI